MRWRAACHGVRGVLHGGIWCGVLESDGHGGEIKCGQWCDQVWSVVSATLNVKLCKILTHAVTCGAHAQAQMLPGTLIGYLQETDPAITSISPVTG